MAQHDYDLANATGAAFRTDINNVLSAIATLNSGATAPSTTFAYQFWFDTTNNLLKIRDGADAAWVTVASLSGTTWIPQISGLPVGGGPAFMVTRGGTNQTGIAHQTETKIQWTTKEFDTNNDFDSATNYRFTPSVAGKYVFVAVAAWVSLSDQVFSSVSIYKNGAGKRRAIFYPSGGGNNAGRIAVSIEDMNGTTDYVEVFARQDTGVSKDIFGNASYTFFCGMRIG
jgi:hypothetical protein